MNISYTTNLQKENVEVSQSSGRMNFEICKGYRKS